MKNITDFLIEQMVIASFAFGIAMIIVGLLYVIGLAIIAIIAM